VAGQGILVGGAVYGTGTVVGGGVVVPVGPGRRDLVGRGLVKVGVGLVVVGTGVVVDGVWVAV
jgi:hypothetical protein